MAGGTTDDRADERPDVAEEVHIPVAETLEKLGRALDIGQQEGDGSAWQAREVNRARLELPLEALLPKLTVEETERHDAVSLRGTKKPLARPLASPIVLEAGLVEPGEGIADMRRVVDREPSAAL